MARALLASILWSVALIVCIALLTWWLTGGVY